jgi:hypothetical protein
MCLIHHFAGAFTHQPEELSSRISVQAADLIKRAFDDVDPTRLLDYHTHIAGLGTDGRDAFVNPKMLTWRNPLHHLKFKVYLSAAAVTDVEQADEQMVARLARLIRSIAGHGKHRLLAMDQHYNRDGTPNLEKTEFYVANDYIFRLVREHPDCFEPVISLTPIGLTHLQSWRVGPGAGRAWSSGCPTRWA